MKFKYVVCVCVCVCVRERERELFSQMDSQPCRYKGRQVQTVGHRDAQYWCCSEALRPVARVPAKALPGTP